MTGMKDEDKDSFMGLWDGLPEDVQKELLKAVEESSATSAEEFVNEIMIGESAPGADARQPRIARTLRMWRI